MYKLGLTFFQDHLHYLFIILFIESVLIIPDHTVSLLINEE